jgi:uncharacterized pyridoxamine 5'-phosphate oxidase family protein
MTDKPDFWQKIDGIKPGHLATYDGEYPRVRPVTFVHFEKKLWVLTGMNDAKIAQIQKHPKVEVHYPLGGEGDSDGTGYLRLGGTAVVIHDQTIKKKLAEHTPYFKDYWKTADDTTYALLQILIEHVEWLKPGEMMAKSFDV